VRFFQAFFHRRLDTKKDSVKARSPHQVKELIISVRLTLASVKKENKDCEKRSLRGLLLSSSYFLMLLG
jgi:hypothetical protein